MSAINDPDDGRPGWASEEQPAPERSCRLVELTRSECLELLAAGEVGRVVLNTAANVPPMIRPVNYHFDVRSQSVVFRTGEGTKFYELTQSARALFEIDSIDPETRTGWSVIISGVAQEVTQPFELQRLSQLGLASWAPGERPHWIRVKAQVVSGRRILLDAASPHGNHG